ncbi:MAG: hypothetical protein WBC71_04760 [Salaquimonas sp.]
MNGLTQIHNELSLWKDAGQKVRIWWRDDDAIKVTPELEQLEELAEIYEMPMLLAVIPALVDPRLGDFVSHQVMMQAAVHGYAHQDHSTIGQKKTELTASYPLRSVGHVFDELRESRSIIKELFGEPASQLIVPPWNRVDKEISEKLGEVGFKLLSGFTFKRLSNTIPQLNCQLDLMHWKPERQGKTEQEVFTELQKCLYEAREKNFAPIGILSHHLVHDKEAWKSTRALMAFIQSNNIFVAFSAHDLLPR